MANQALTLAAIAARDGFETMLAGLAPQKNLSIVLPEANGIAHTGNEFGGPQATGSNGKGAREI